MGELYTYKVSWVLVAGEYKETRLVEFAPNKDVRLKEFIS